MQRGMRYLGWPPKAASQEADARKQDRNLAEKKGQHDINHDCYRYDKEDDDDYYSHYHHDYNYDYDYDYDYNYDYYYAYNYDYYYDFFGELSVHCGVRYLGW